MHNEKLLRLNGTIIAMYYMQFSFLIPLMNYISSSILVALFSMIMITILMIKNDVRYLNRKLFIFYYLFIIIFLLKILFGETQFNVLLYIVIFTAPPIFIFNFPFCYETFLKMFVIISRICFLLIIWTPFLGTFNYMRFGYGMVPIVMGAYIDFVYKRSSRSAINNSKTMIMNILIMILGFLSILIYGARGCILVLMIFVALDRLLINRKNIIKNAVCVLAAVIVYLNLFPILNFFEDISKKIGIYSYSITKFKMQLVGGFDYASSGRDRIYQDSLEKIKTSPLTGNTISLDEDGGSYSHNLFLQVGEDFGIIAIVLLAVFLIYVIYLLASKKITLQEKIILLIFTSSSVGRLMVSSTLWRRPEFWMLVAFVLVYHSSTRQYAINTYSSHITEVLDFSRQS